MSGKIRDPSLDTLLALDGQVLVVDPDGGHWVKFVARSVPVSRGRPHGLNYSLTLHDRSGQRLVGYDNAHPVAGNGRRRKGVRRDHRHRLRSVRPYEYSDAATLLADFWSDVDGVLRERGVYAMKRLKVGIASYEDMKARTMAVARGDIRPGRGDPKVWFTSAESFAKVLSDKNRDLLGVIARMRPGSLTQLEELTGRRKSNLSRTLKTLEGYGLVSLRKGTGGRIIPEVSYDEVSLVLPLKASGGKGTRAA